MLATALFAFATLPIAAPVALAEEAPPDVSVLVRVAPSGTTPTEVLEQADVSTSDARSFDELSVVAVDVSTDELAKLASAPGVVDVQPDIWLHSELEESTSLIGARSAWAEGYTGSGQTVAVVDTGVDAAHPFLKGKVSYEACFSPSCPNGQTTMVGAGAAAPCGVANDCGHGTHVAGIIAGEGTINGQPISGVAPGTNIAAIQVFSPVDEDAECGGPGTAPCARARLSDVLAALDHLTDRAAQLSLAAVNLSVSSDAAQDRCDGNVLKAAVDRLEAVGVATVVSSGNAGSSTGLGLPACISSTISVGATYDDRDVVWPLSNSSSDLDLLAPGVDIISALPGARFGSASGTSAAAPHVSAAYAIATQLRGQRSASGTLSFLQERGTPIRDRKSGVVTNRLDLAGLLAPQYSSVLGPAADATERYTPVSGDFDGDGRDDIFWYGPDGGDETVGYGGPGGTFSIVTANAPGDDYQPIPGDFDGDGRDDIFWYAPGGRGEYVWYGRGNRGFAQVATLASNGTYEPYAGDYDGDGAADILWYGVGSRPDYLWYGRSDRWFDGGTPFPVGGIYEPEVGDLDGDGLDDILWYAPGPANDYIWYANRGRGAFSGQVVRVNGSYQAFVGDFDGNRSTDVFWYAPGAARDYLWYHGGRGSFRSLPTSVSGTYDPVPGDYDGDGRADIAWFAAGPSRDYVWFGAGVGRFRY
ncbi:MAG: S8 family serine peptidase [Actinomycetota bacterium]|nr:S8 family serine peptidase [Actinomycetota bacterium]